MTLDSELKRREKVVTRPPNHGKLNKYKQKQLNRKIIIKIERKLANNMGIRKANKVVSDFSICAQVFYHGTYKPKTTQRKKKKNKEEERRRDSSGRDEEEEEVALTRMSSTFFWRAVSARSSFFFFLYTEFFFSQWLVL